MDFNSKPLRKGREIFYSITIQEAGNSVGSETILVWRLSIGPHQLILPQTRR